MPEEAKAISTIIVSYNTKELTRKCLASLFASDLLPGEVIVVDNNSSDGSAQMVKEEFPNVHLVTNKENVGFAKANNQAIKEATGKYIFLLNSDTEIGAKTLRQMHDFLEANGNVAGVVPQLVYPDKSWQSVGGYFPTFFNVFRYLIPFPFLFPAAVRKKLKDIAIFRQETPAQGLELDYITGAAAMFRKSVLDEVGLLGEEYFMYFEETDLCWRVRRAGYGLMAIKTDSLVHVYGGSYKGRYDSKRIGIFLESLQIFVKKNYSGIKRASILLEIRLLKNISLKIKSLRQ